MAVVDAGANIGYYTTLLSQGLGRKGAISFEPERTNFKILMANALLARQSLGAIPPIYLDSRAVSDSVAKATLNLFQKNLGLHSLEARGEGGMLQRRIHTVTLDNLRGFDGESEPVIRRRIDLIKADVHGPSCGYCARPPKRSRRTARCCASNSNDI